MPRPGSVNYHVHSSQRQAFGIDAEGRAGHLVSPHLVPTRVMMNDLREHESSVSIAADGVAYLHAPTRVISFDEGDAWRSSYDAELETLLSREVAAKKVIVFDHTVRVDDPSAERRPARNVHSDYSRLGAKDRLTEVLGEQEAMRWERGHYAFINVWRPISAPVKSAPLGFVRPKSVAQDDWVRIDLDYPDRVGHILGLVASSKHEWVFRSEMTPDEVVVFTTFDSSGRPPVAHSAVDLEDDDSNHFIRRSIESRTLVLY